MTAETINLASLRLSPAEEADLRWFWCEVEGEMGLRSSLGPMIDRCTLGTQAHRGSVPMGPAEHGGVSDHQIDAVSRARHISQRLGQLPRAHQRTLEAHYGPGLPRRQAIRLPELGALASLVMLTAERDGAGRRAVVEACTANKAKDRSKQALLSRLTRTAEAALARACRAYREAR